MDIQLKYDGLCQNFRIIELLPYCTVKILLLLFLILARLINNHYITLECKICAWYGNVVLLCSNNPHVVLLGFRVLYCMNRTDDQKDQANGLEPRFSIPKHHMYAIWFFATLALLIAIILPAPDDLTNVDKAYRTTGSIPDITLSSKDVINVDDPNATESIDAESIPEQELTNPDEAELVTEEPKSPEEAKAQMFSDAEWQSIEISKGDNASDIFNNLNLDFGALKAITEVPKYGDSIKKLALGEKLSFLVSAQGKLLVLIKPISKTEQIRYTIVDPLGPYKFNAIVESLDAHLNADNLEPNVPKHIVSDKTTDDLLKKVIDKEDISLAKNKEKAQLESEKEKKQEEQKKPQAQRKTLYIFKISNGDTLNSLLKKEGLSDNDLKTVIKALEGRVSPKQLHQGDEFRILFENNKKDARINAIYAKTKKSGKVSMFRHPKQHKFYPDANTLKHIKTKSTFNRYPVAGPVRITSNFNPKRRHPITGKIRPHNGTDFGVKVGTPVMAPADGVVVRATYQRAAGNYIVIQHANSRSTVYMHLSKILVKVGDKVSARQRIALSGNTGASTGPHLHYELRINNRPVNAMKTSLPSGSTSEVISDPKFKKIIAEYKRKLQID